MDGCSVVCIALKQGQVYIWKKRLSAVTGSCALGIFYTNIFGQPSRVSFKLSDFSITDAAVYNVTEVLTGKQFGLYKPWHTVDCEVNPMGALLLHFNPIRYDDDDDNQYDRMTERTTARNE